MFTHIKTSRENREVVAKLTRKLNLGSENIIARIAFVYSISKDRILNLTEIKDSQGKEYSKTVLFGDYFSYYISLACIHYNLYKTDKDLPKYIKMHVDDGLQLINNEIQDNPNIDGFDFLIEKIEYGLKEIV
jgi:DNA sulfur modification protein DndE